MRKANITFTSNVYPIEKGISTDTKYLRILVDYDRLKYLKKKYYINNLTEVQNEIVRQGALCINSKNDPCWGLSENGYTCKCVNIDCPNFKECRPTFDDEEYFTFSPDIVDISSQYNYSVLETSGYHPNSTFDSNYKKDDFDNIDQKTSNIDRIEATALDVIGALRNNQEKIKNNVSDSNDSENANQSKVSHIIDEADDISQTVSTKEPINEAEDTISLKIDFNPTLPENKQDETISIEIELQELPKQEERSSSPSKFLLAKQDNIINADSKANLLVNAGPGTGKTHTLIQRINNLVIKQEIDPEAIIVLCFTNAAVNEIKSRLREFVNKGGSRGLRKVEVRTFHSFAGWLRVQANEEFKEYGWQPVSIENLDFDKSIETAISIVRRFEGYIFESWEHFFVDEIQDLTDVRANLVIHMTEACIKNSCGVSLFGDYCQAIYDYTQKYNKNSINSEQFYKGLFRTLQNEAQYLELDYNYRQTNELKAISTNLRKSILDNDKKEMLDSARKLLSDIATYDKTLTQISEGDLDSLRRQEKICLLCRNNAEVLNLSSIMWQKSIPHLVNVYDPLDNYAAWIANVFHDYHEKTISEDKFKKIFSERVDDKYLDCTSIWDRINEIMHLKGDSMRVDELLRAIKNSRIEDPVFRVNSNINIILSNIHQAKGREYQSVILDKSFVSGLAENENDAGEYKALYVAITRPKSNLFLSDLSKNREYRKIGSAKERWGKFKNSKLTHIEFITKHDADKYSFKTKNQIYVQNNISAGDEIILVKNKYNPFYEYNIVHNKNDKQTVIGTVSESFSKELKLLVNPKNRSEMPESIDKLYVSEVLTCISDDSTEEKGQYSTWCWVKFNGIGHLNYDVY